MFDIAIVGGGAAGLSLAAYLKRHRPDLSVALFEAQSKTGRKIRASGNGKCNITNRTVSPQNYFSDNPAFVTDVLKGYDTTRIVRFLQNLGILATEDEEGKYFPMCKEAAFVAEMLHDEALNAGVTLYENTPVESIEKDHLRFVLHTPQKTFFSRYLVLACGSNAAVQLGGSDKGYALAQALGHRLISPLPALVQLVCDPNPFAKAAGVKHKAEVTLKSDGNSVATTYGDILFTSYGISGLAVLDISPYVSHTLAQYGYAEIVIDLFPHMTLQQLRDFLGKHTRNDADTTATLWLARFIPKKLAHIVLDDLDMHRLYERTVRRKQLQRIAYALKHLSCFVTETRGFKGAEVSLGGIDTRDIDAATMASLICERLYLAGEMLDVTGARGGYNFHFAFTSALRIAEHLIKEA